MKKDSFSNFNTRKFCEAKRACSTGKTRYPDYDELQRAKGYPQCPSCLVWRGVYKQDDDNFFCERCNVFFNGNERIIRTIEDCCKKPIVIKVPTRSNCV